MEMPNVGYEVTNGVGKVVQVIMLATMYVVGRLGR